MTYYGRWTYKYEEAARRGAIARPGRPREARAPAMAGTRSRRRAARITTSSSSRARQQPVLLQGWIQRGVAEDLFRRAGLDFEAVKRLARTARLPPDRPRMRRFSADFGVDRPRVESHNVLGKIAGAKQPDETIMFAGHWDAYGLGAPDAQRQDDSPRRARRRVRGGRSGRARPRLQGRAAGRTEPWSSPPGRRRSGACSAPNIMRPNPLFRWRRRSPT